MNQSRTKRYRPGRVPREKRARPIFGAVSYIDGRTVQDQSDNLFRCWNCGFVCNTNVHKLGDGEGFRIVDQVENSPYNMGASSQTYPCSHAGSFDMMITVETVSTPLLMKLDGQGNPIQAMHNLTMVSPGCPLCGTENYK